MLTKITGFDITQVDVAHRTSKRENAPIIILFNKKSDKTNFFKQKKKFHNLRAHQLFQSTQLVDEEVTLPGIDKKQGEETSDNKNLIFLNESFTPTNRRLLKEAKKASRQHNYKQKGYTVNGDVRVKKMIIMTTLLYYAQRIWKKSYEDQNWFACSYIFCYLFFCFINITISFSYSLVKYFVSL